VAISPVLDDTDPVLAEVIRRAGFAAPDEDTGVLPDAEGLTLDDVKACCYANRELVDDGLVVSHDGTVQSQFDGWAEDSEIAAVPDGEVLAVGDDSMPQNGTWLIDGEDESSPERVMYVHGWTYDMNGAAADLLEQLGAKLKMQFTFSDGSGNYDRQAKWQMVTEMARKLRAKARVVQVAMTRSDTGSGGWTGPEAFFQRIV
jgi:hypothetical protein